MKVRISYTEDFPDDFRRAIRRYYGQSGLATREECRNWARRFGSSMNDELATTGGGEFAMGRTALGE